MTIGLIDIDSKIPNLALMKISNYYKSLGEQVEFVQENKKYEKIYASTIFTRSMPITEKLIEKYEGNIDIGGTGWDIKKELPIEIEKTRPDYNLYTAKEIASRMKGIGTKEHKLRKANEIASTIPIFTLQGAFYLSELKGIDKLIMKLMKNVLTKQITDKGTLNDDDRDMLKLLNEGGDRVDSYNLNDILKYIKDNRI